MANPATGLHRTLILVATLVAVLGAAATSGCDAGPRPAAAGQPGSATTSAAHPGTATPAEPASPADPASEPGTTSDSRTTSDAAPADPASDRQFCQAISLNLSVLTTAASSPDDPSLEQGIAQLRHLADIAPVEIKHDLAVTADFDQHILDQIRAGRSPEIKETPELTAALTHEAKWVAAHCR